MGTPTQGNVTDITTNNAEVLMEAIAKSAILNAKNTHPDPSNSNIYQTTEVQTVVLLKSKTT
ncbi:hypothetical protein WMZ97_18385 [Lentibacillus sp. N15]